MINPVFKVKMDFNTARCNSSEPGVCEATAKRSRKALLWMMEALSQINQYWIADNPSFSLYDNFDLGGSQKVGVGYIPEINTEEWLDIPTIQEEGGGDCEDLACALVAQYRQNGIPARPRIKWRTMPDGSLRFHGLCIRPHKYAAMSIGPQKYTKEEKDGIVDDPSAELGMYHYSSYLSGTSTPKFIYEMLVKRAKLFQSLGNLNGARTLLLRANQALE